MSPMKPPVRPRENREGPAPDDPRLERMVPHVWDALGIFPPVDVLRNAHLSAGYRRRTIVEQRVPPEP
jgi:hypothetical protein